MKSSLYLTLSKEELERVFAGALQTRTRSVRLLTGGLFNTTYFADTERYGAVVLRVGPVNRHLLMPFEHSLMESEQLVYSLCREQKIPVSEVLATDTAKELIGRDFMIVRYIPSRPMSETELTPEDNARICRRIGEETAKLHSIENARFGRIADVKNGRGFNKWSDCMKDELQKWESVAAGAGLFSEEELLRVREIFEKVSPVLDEIRVPKLVHTDLWKGNILIGCEGETSGDAAGTAPEFAAIIDADRAIWGDPGIEFSSIQWTYDEPAFWEGYGKELEQDLHSRIRRSVYTLLWSLFDGYVFLKEYNEPEEAAAKRSIALEQMDLLEQMLKQTAGE